MPDPAAQRMFQWWVDLVGDLILHTAPTMPNERLLEALHATFGCDVSWSWRDADGTFGFLMHDPIPEWPVEGQLEYWGTEALRLHPLVHWFGVTGDLTAMTLERVPAQVADPRGLQIVRHHLVPVGLEQQLSIPYRQTSGGAHRAFVLAKGGTDFVDAEVELARRIQPLLVLLARQCRVLAENAQNGSGQGSSNGSSDGHSADARAPRVGLVQEASATAGVTGRELAVLRLLADGKTAAAIGHCLGISPRTVHVHLTHVYSKLGVNDRLMAVAVARQVGLLPDVPARAGRAPSIPRQRHPEPVPTTVVDVRGQRAVAWRPGWGAILLDPTP